MLLYTNKNNKKTKQPTNKQIKKKLKWTDLQKDNKTNQTMQKLILRNMLKKHRQNNKQTNKLNHKPTNRLIKKQRKTHY